jgi:hypothetical protein
MNTLLKYSLFLGATLASLSGCISDETDVMLEQPVSKQKNVTLVNGQVYSVNTLGALEGVEVKLLVNGHDYQLSNSSEVTGDVHTDGYFSFEDVPLGQHTIIIEHPDYATVTHNVTFNSEDNLQSHQLGKIGLSASTQMDIVVSSDNGNVVNAVVQAELISPDYFCVEGSQIQLFGNEDRISAVTNAEGIATLQNLSSCGIYRIVVPALDTDNDGIFDYSTKITDDSYYNVTRNFNQNYPSSNRYGYVRGILPQTVPGPLNIFLDETEYDYNVTVINRNISEDTSDLDLYNDTAFLGRKNAYKLNDSNKIEFRFSYPININREISLTVMDIESSTNNNYQYSDLPILVTLDDTETVLTIQPAVGEFPAVRLMKLVGAVVAKGKPTNNSITLVSNNNHLVSFPQNFEITAKNRDSRYVDFSFTKPVFGTVYINYRSTGGQARTETFSFSHHSVRLNYDSNTKLSSLGLTDSLYSWDNGAVDMSYELEDDNGAYYTGDISLPANNL